MLHYIYQEYVEKNILSWKFWLFALIVWITVASLWQTAVSRLSGYQIGAWELMPCFMNCASSITYYALFIFLIAWYPSWDGATNLLPRLGKRKWIISQYICVFLMSVIYYLIWSAAFIIAILPRLTWTNEWSSFIHKVIESIDFEYNLHLNFTLLYSNEVLQIGSPFKVWLLTFLLVVLVTTFLGIWMVTLNICLRQGFGTVLVSFILLLDTIFECIPSLLDNDFIKWGGAHELKRLIRRYEPYLNPMYQDNLYNMVMRNTRPLMQRIEIGAAYYGILIAVAVLLGICYVRRTDLCSNH